VKEKIILRPWSLIDAPSLVSNANNKNISDNLKDSFPHPYSLENAVSFINLAISQKKEDAVFWAIDMNGEAIGCISGHLKKDVYKKNVEIGYWLGQRYWGKGIITDCIKEVTHYFFSNFDIERIFAVIYASNTGSQKAIQKAGFIHEATLKRNVFKNNKLLDSYVYALLKEKFIENIQ